MYLAISFDHFENVNKLVKMNDMKMGKEMHELHRTFDVAQADISKFGRMSQPFVNSSIYLLVASVNLTVHAVFSKGRLQGCF